MLFYKGEATEINNILAMDSEEEYSGSDLNSNQDESDYGKLNYIW